MKVRNFLWLVSALCFLLGVAYFEYVTLSTVRDSGARMVEDSHSLDTLRSRASADNRILQGVGERYFEHTQARNEIQKLIYSRRTGTTEIPFVRRYKNAQERRQRTAAAAVATTSTAAALKANVESEIDAVPHYFMVVGVLSAPAHSEERAVCRRTWLRFATLSETQSYKVLFLIGNTTDDSVEQQLRDEQATYNDLLRVHSEETYRRLTYKTTAFLDYLTRQSVGSSFVSREGLKRIAGSDEQPFTYDWAMKTDDDSFVRLDLLERLLAPIAVPCGARAAGDNDDSVLHNAYWGYQNKRVKRETTVGHKWYDGIWKQERYPTYALGSGYALSCDLVKAISSLESRDMYPLEDVGVGIYIDGLFTAEHQRELDAPYKERERRGSRASLLTRLHADESLFPQIKTGTVSTFCVETMIIRRHCDDTRIMETLFSNYDRCGRMCGCT